jgi:hypothetical protein
MYQKFCHCCKDEFAVSQDKTQLHKYQTTGTITAFWSDLLIVCLPHSPLPASLRPLHCIILLSLSTAVLFCFKAVYNLIKQTSVSKIVSLDQCQQPLPPHLTPLPCDNLCVFIPYFLSKKFLLLSINTSMWPTQMNDSCDRYINRPLSKDLRLYSQWIKFQWLSCHRMAPNHRTLMSKNFTLTQSWN